jgi:hypothetical protein
MPYLRAKEIAGFLVQPSIEEAHSRYVVQCYIGVGTTFQPSPVTIVAASELAVVLFNAAGQELEQVTRPEENELPVIGGPGLYAVAQFEFQPSGARPSKLNVTLKSQTATFEVSDIAETPRTFDSPPQTSQEYPIRRAPEGIIDNLVDILRKIGRFFKNLFSNEKCCLRIFNDPANINHHDPATFGRNAEDFDMIAAFEQIRAECFCRCCEYRQFVRGSFFRPDGSRFAHPLLDAPMAQNDYREDGMPAGDPRLPPSWPAGQGLAYGHRDLPDFPTDHYTINRPQGCDYNGHDRPSCPATWTARLDFIGLIIDTCRGEVVDSRQWMVVFP